MFKPTVTTLALIVAGFSLMHCIFKNASEEKGCQNSFPADEVSLEINMGRAHEFGRSGLDKNKIMIVLAYSDTSNIRRIQYDVVLNKFDTIVEEPPWEFIFFDTSSVYQDNVDSILWVGHTQKLVKYDLRSKEVELLPIYAVKRIIPYDNGIYFVTSSGLRYLDITTDSIFRITDLPIRHIFKSQMLDQNTLFLEDQITYDLKTGLWKEGIYLYDQYFEGGMGSFVAEKGIGLFYSNNETYIVLPSGKRKIKFENPYGTAGVTISPPYLWENNYQWDDNIGSVNRYNIETDHWEKFKFLLPRINNYSSQFIYDDDIVWIYRYGQLFFINTVTGETFDYAFESGNSFLSLLIDECNLYLLFEDKLVIKSKERFIQICPKFNKAFYDSLEIAYRAPTPIDTISLITFENLFKHNWYAGFNMAINADSFQKGLSDISWKNNLRQVRVKLDNDSLISQVLYGFPYGKLKVNDSILLISTISEGEVTVNYNLSRINIKQGKVTDNYRLLSNGGDEGDYYYTYGHLVNDSTFSFTAVSGTGDQVPDSISGIFTFTPLGKWEEKIFKTHKSANKNGGE